MGILCWVCLLLPLTSSTQSRFQFGLLPAVNLNKGLDGGFKMNFKSESRQIIYKAEEYDLQYELVDFSLITSKKIGLSSALAGGYLMRIKDQSIINRLIQQFTLVHNVSTFRLAHRFSADQTFEEAEAMELRLRYRLASQLPLSGQSVDPKEFYIKLSNEYLNAFQDQEHDLEIRVVVVLGYEFTDNNKLEFGVDNRFDSFIDDNLRTRSWMNIGWYVAL